MSRMTDQVLKEFVQQARKIVFDEGSKHSYKDKDQAALLADKEWWELIYIGELHLSGRRGSMSREEIETKLFEKVIKHMVDDIARRVLTLEHRKADGGFISSVAVNK